jgi:predicted RNase H-like nuclease (RuvC/YqgF family)
MTEAEQIAQQAETIERYRLEAHRLRRRCEELHGMAERLSRRVEELEFQTTPEAIAERIFSATES